jgi:NFU1 iron-sulfur cluster scaffold homolog, mitochondrial
MFIQTEQTPNPNTLKFLPGRDVLGKGARDFPSVEAGEASPLAKDIFAVDGVLRVYFGADFITVTKASETEWPHIKPAILGAVMDHFVTGRPLLLDASPAEDDDAAPIFYDADTAKIVEEIKELIELRVRPSVAQDGGDILFHSFEADTGLLRLKMQGSCSGCPSSTITLKNGIENMMRHYIPEVTRVEAA